jgi:Uma2 family endonuclease
MSTVPHQRGSSSQPGRWRYGYRYVPVKDARGREIEHVQVPLTREDVLHPQEGDAIAESNAHGDDCGYLKNAFRAQLGHDPHALVLSDCCIYWDDPTLRHHCPDISVILGVRDVQREWPSFHVDREGVRPALLIEITSPSTRSIDVNEKRRHYFRAQVPLYVIVDAREDDHHRDVEIIGYRRGATRFQRLPLSDEGRLWLEVVGLWLGSENGRLACYTPESKRIGDYLEMAHGRTIAEEAAAAARQKVRELQAEIRRLRGEG